jgi:putative SOS response-associated peptidase YedK
MCGRYRLSRRKELIEQYFGSAPWDDDWNPRYNIAPTQPVPVIRQNPKEPVREFLAHALGFDTVMGKRCFRRGEND